MRRARTADGAATLDNAPATPTLSRRERAIAPFIPSITDSFFVCMLFGGLFITQSHVLGIDGDAGWTIRLGQIILTHGLPRAEPLLSVAPSPMLGGWIDWEWLAQVLYALAFRLAGLNGVAALAAALVTWTLTSLLSILRRRGASLPLALLLTIAAIPLIALVWSARAQLFSLPLILWWAEWLWRYWQDGDGRRWLWRFPLLTILWANLHGGFLWGLALLALATALAWALALVARWRRANVAVAAPAAAHYPHPRGLTLALVASLVATLCTPWGVALPLHLIAFASNPLIGAYTQEYQSPDFHHWGQQVFLVLLVALVGSWLWAARRGGAASASAPPIASSAHPPTAPAAASAPVSSPPGAPWQPTPLALTLCGAWMLLTFVYVRLMPAWALIALPYLIDALVTARAPYPLTRPAPHPPAIPPGVRSARRGQALAFLSRIEATDALVGRGGLWRALALVALLALLLNGGLIPGAPWGANPALAVQFDARALPVAAAAHLRAVGLPPGRGFNPYEWGGYLDDVLPAYHVFIDSRSDVYSPQFLRDYLTIITAAPGWPRLLDHYTIAWALLPTGLPLAQLLARIPPWRCQPADAQGVATLCVRPPGSIPIATGAVAGGSAWAPSAHNSHPTLTQRRDATRPQPSHYQT